MKCGVGATLLDDVLVLSGGCVVAADTGRTVVEVAASERREGLHAAATLQATTNRQTLAVDDRNYAASDR